MAKEFSESFYNSKAWKVCRKSYIADRVLVDGGMCERCHKHLGFILHHKKLLTPNNINDPDVTLNAENLEYLCKACHDEEHFKDIHGVERKQTRCIFGPDGQPIPREEETDYV